MKIGDLIGNHYPNGKTEGLTVEDLINLLKQVPPAARTNYLRVWAGDRHREVVGMGVAQSDQAEANEANIYLLLEGEEL